MHFIHTTLLDLLKQKNAEQVFAEKKLPVKTKNLFLYPTDSFGALKTGVADEIRDYDRETPAGDGFEIIGVV